VQPKPQKQGNSKHSKSQKLPRPLRGRALSAPAR